MAIHKFGNKTKRGRQELAKKYKLPMNEMTSQVTSRGFSGEVKGKGQYLSSISKDTARDARREEGRIFRRQNSGLND